MSQASALLEAIYAAPKDLARRLVYADLLMAEGDSRGEFITQQCRLSQMDLLDEQAPALRAQTERLRASHSAEWLAPIFDLLDVPDASRVHAALRGSARWQFQRGFLSTLTLEIAEAARVAAELATLEPIEGMRLTVTESIPREQLSFPEVSSWRYLGVEPSDWFTDYSLSHVLSWGLEKVEELVLAKCSVGVGGCQMLANEANDLGDTFEDFVRPPPLPLEQLLHLDLRGCTIGDEGVEVLARAPTLTKLQSLDLTQNRLSSAAASSIMHSEVLTRLVDLSLAGNKELGLQLHLLAGWGVLKQLRRLALPQTAPAEALAALFARPSSALRELVLTNNKALVLDPERLAGCAEHLTSLDLGTTRIGDARLAQLLAQPSISSLTSLKLNGCSLSDKGITALVESDLQHLGCLDLSSNKLSDAGLTRLAQWPGLRHVTYLRLANNRKLGHGGYTALVESPHLDPVALLVGKLADPAVQAMVRERYGPRVVIPT